MNNINKNGFSSIEQMTGAYAGGKTGTVKNHNASYGMSFAQILNYKQEANDELSARISECSVKFSKHAAIRLNDRNPDFSEAQMKRLEEGAKLASQKGIKESLVMIDNLAFIVNVPNNTVITAISDGEDKVFTNIDGAVIM